jgi:hypothetical protein
MTIGLKTPSSSEKPSKPTTPNLGYRRRLLALILPSNEQSFLPVALHSEGHEFPPEIDAYRVIAEEGVL